MLSSSMRLKVWAAGPVTWAPVGRRETAPACLVDSSAEPPSREAVQRPAACCFRTAPCNRLYACMPPTTVGKRRVIPAGTGHTGEMAAIGDDYLGHTCNMTRPLSGTRHTPACLLTRGAMLPMKEKIARAWCQKLETAIRLQPGCARGLREHDFQR